ISAIRRELQAAMERGAGVFRTEESLKEAVEEVRGLRERYRDIALDDRDRAFNTELVAALELDNMLDVAETVVRSGLERRESRGYGGPGRPEPHQGRDRREPGLPLVVPDGRVRLLRDDGEREASPYVFHLPPRVLPEARRGWTPPALPGGPRPGRGHDRLHGEA